MHKNLPWNDGKSYDRQSGQYYKPNPISHEPKNKWQYTVSQGPTKPLKHYDFSAVLPIQQKLLDIFFYFKTLFVTLKKLHRRFKKSF
jgi:hypothetical protein